MNLDNHVGKLPFIGPTYILRLEKLGINTIEDLLYHVPKRYKDFRITSQISKVQLGEKVTIQGKLESFKNIYTKAGKVLQKAEISDKTGQIQAIWFNQRYLARTFTVGENYSFSGKIDLFDRQKSLISPDYEKLEKNHSTIHTGRLVPI